jgi:centromere protein C
MNKRYHSTFDDMMDDDSERSFSPTGHLGPAASSPRVRSPAIVKAKQKAKKVRSPEPESEPESEPEFEPDAQPEFEPDFEPDFEPEFEPDFEPERDPSLEPDDVDSQPIRRLGSKKTVAPIEDDDGRVPDTYDEDDVEVSVIVGNETLMDETFNMDAEGSESDESVSDNEPDYVDEDEEEEEEEEDSDNGGDGDETIPYADDYDEEDVIYPHDVTEGESFYAGLDESANLEEEAIWAENASGSDSDPDRTPRAAPGKRPRDEPVARSPGGRPIIRRTRKSEVGVDPENGYQGDFKTRRSGRMHIRPLEYWRNETVRYKPAHLLPAIAEVVRPAAPEPRSRPKRAPRPKPQIVRPPTPDSDDEVEVGIDDNVNQRAVVHEYGKNMMRSRRE